jgi:hypothetical protein
MLVLALDLTANSVVIEMPEHERLDVAPIGGKSARRARRTNKKMKQRGF